MDREVVDLYLDDIIPNRFQPREVFNEQALRELSDSIKAHGVIQPIIVRKIGDKYEIIAGERRYKAAAMAGLTKIPAIIRNLDDKETSKVALLENLQRKDLTPIEEARTYQKILELDSMTQEELGRTMGKSQAAIANKMRLLSLPDEIQEALLRDQISERHARSLLNLKTPEEQIKMLHDIINKRMTVRELDNAIKVINGEEPVYQVEKENTVVNDQTPKDLVEPVKESPIVEEQNDSSDTTIPQDGFMFDLSSKQEQPKEIEFDETQRPLSKEIESIFSDNNLETSNNNNNNNNNNKVKDSYSIEELLEDEELYSLKDAVNEIKKSIKNIEQKGFLVKLEEMDFESTYQVIIKIDKNN